MNGILYTSSSHHWAQGCDWQAFHWCVFGICLEAYCSVCRAPLVACLPVYSIAGSDLITHSPRIREAVRPFMASDHWASERWHTIAKIYTTIGVRGTVASRDSSPMPIARTTSPDVTRMASALLRKVTL